MKTPRILISTGGGDPVNYENALRLVGGTPVSRYCPPPEPLYDGLILAGGGDIDPILIGEENQGSYDIDPRRDEAEFALIEAYRKADLPILGICRGHQMMNIALGGRLRQDLGPSLLWFHKTAAHEGGGDALHRICTREGSNMEALYGPVTMVNSSHHQVLETPGDGMQTTAWTESGLMEAAEHSTLPIFTVQFHPERMGEAGLPIFRWLVEACRTE
jgi:putative glutamine amidotransferase